ncbi:MAG: dipeptidase PepV [Firmicutes bacterium]|nr:dipeptidase PepV [Bacillota bacterium]
MDFLEQVNRKLEENRLEMETSLAEILRVPSVASSQEGVYPFGEHVQQAFQLMLDNAKDEGFETFNADNYGGHIDFPGEGTGIVGVVGHLDVVPEGDGWDFAPYGGEIKDGYICGRGTMDDKGPVMAAFYAMKALKECGFVPESTIRLILGLDEETNWEGMDYYLEHVDSKPDCGFTPDGDFPVISGEKGIIVFDLARKFPQSQGKGLVLSSVRGGNAANSVPDFARAVVINTAEGGYDSIKEMVAEARREKGRKINCRGTGKSLEITVSGKSAHGAKPEQGVNAVSILMEFLGQLDFINDGAADFISFYNSCIGYDLGGERIGCAMEDDESGKLVFNVGMIELDKKAAKLTVNVRYPVTADADKVYDGIGKVTEPYGIGIIKGKHQAPIFKSADDPLIKTLMDVYRKHTGDRESEPLVIGGGTYARAMDNIVAFGARFPGEPELGHQKNEKISAENLMKMTRIYAEALYLLAR